MISNATLTGHTAGLDLVIRHVLAGLGHGIHAGRERGAGVEFSEYRAYAPGDEWRRVDWKLLARADRYYVREAERDSHVAVWLVLDATASMAEPSRSMAGVDKLWFARTMLACAAAIAQRQGDAFGLAVLSGSKVSLNPAARGPRQLQRVLAQLTRCEPSGQLPSADALRSALRFAASPSLVFAVSDFLDWPSPLAEALQRLRAMRHDVRVLALQTRAEADASFDQRESYVDPGAARMVRFDSTEYAQRRSAHFDGVAAAWKKADVPYLMGTIEEPVGQVLRAWLRLAERHR